MIQDFIREFFGWLGYLQRGSIVIQIIAFIGAILIEPALIRRLPIKLKQEYSNLIVPIFLVLMSIVCMAFSLPGGFLRYLSLAWLTWRLIDPIQALLEKYFPRFPTDELDKAIFRPLFLVTLILTFFQMIGSRESLSVIQIGKIFGVVITVGKLFTVLVIIYAIFTFASRPASLLAWVCYRFLE